MRARYPDRDGIVARNGVEIRYERYGQGRPAILRRGSQAREALDRQAVQQPAKRTEPPRDRRQAS
jgi:hypothetical protein